MTNRERCFENLKKLMEKDKINRGDIITLWEDINNGWHSNYYTLDWSPKNHNLEEALMEVAERLMEEARVLNISITYEELWFQILEYLGDLN